MRKKIIRLVVSAVMSLSMFASVNVFAADMLQNNSTGTQGGYNYELWKDYGNTSMTLNDGGTFDCSWNNIGNALFRKGRKFDCTKTYQQIGNISVDYGCDYRPSGNSYLCVYGWTRSPLVEYYIVDSWGSWRPPGAQSMGTITVDGGEYDVYETTRVNQPSIDGNTTFKQYWSVRKNKRSSGTISVTDHFKQWERRGLKLGKLYETALTVEGYQSSGSAKVYKNSINVGGTSSNPTPTHTPNPDPNPKPNPNPTVVECENMKINGQYASKINNPFNGVALYANGESCKFTQYFGNGTHNFSLRGCSNNDKMARVDLKIGGEYKGTFYYGGKYPATYTLNNVNHKTGAQEVELVVTADDGNWDAFIDNFTIS